MFVVVLSNELKNLMEKQLIVYGIYFTLTITGNFDHCITNIFELEFVKTDLLIQPWHGQPLGLQHREGQMDVRHKEVQHEDQHKKGQHREGGHKEGQHTEDQHKDIQQQEWVQQQEEQEQ
jgi:hypothetical protein